MSLFVGSCVGPRPTLGLSSHRRLAVIITIMSTQQTQPDDELANQSDEFAKSVDFLKDADDGQVAYGAILVPDRVDHQGDFLRSGTIADIADGFEGRGGVMHATFPGDDHLELVDDRILESDETVGEKELPSGTWLQGWKFHDDDLWELVDDNVLDGYSIGGRIEADIWYSPDAVPDDVEFPDAVVEELDEHGLSPDEVEVREIADARVLENSTVDFPAVPDATHAAKSAGLLKGAPQLTESVVDAQLYLEERGHSEEDARRLAEYLDRTKSKSIVERAKRRIWPSGQTERGGTANQTTRAESREDAELAVLQNMDEEELSDTLSEIKAQNEDLTERVDSLSEKVDESTDESESGENEKTTDEQIAELTDAMKTLGENQEQILGRVERLSEAGGHSQQKADGDTGEDEPSALAKSLGLGNMGTGGA